MNFDHTFIAIRQRGIFEILDLTLHVIRKYFVPLTMLLILGAAPFFVINWFTIGWMTTELNSFECSYIYVWAMLFLVICQAQVGTTFITHYLGQAIFEGRPSVWATIKSSFRVSPFFVWIHGGLRMVIPVTGAAFLLTESSVGSEEFGLVFAIIVALTFIGLLVRAIRPFSSEMLLLERTPIMSTDESTIKYSTRSASLHGVAIAELFGRFTLLACLSIPLTFMIYGSLLIGDNMLNLHIDPEATLVTWYWPIALWIVSGFMAVARFLSYLDIRIRQEGWAVELRVRAESIRLAESMQ